MNSPVSLRKVFCGKWLIHLFQLVKGSQSSDHAQGRSTWNSLHVFLYSSSHTSGLSSLDTFFVLSIAQFSNHPIKSALLSMICLKVFFECFLPKVQAHIEKQHQVIPSWCQIYTKDLRALWRMDSVSELKTIASE